MAKVSIVVPMCNADRYVMRWYGYMKNQTLKDIEVIIVNDSSTDNTLAICEKIVAEDSRFKVFTKKNGGAGAARNYGLAQATGDYVGFVDVDDTIESNMFERMYNTAISTNSLVVKCGFDFVGLSENKNPVIPFTGKYTNRNFMENLLLGYGDGSVCNLLLHSSIARKILFPEGQIMEDIVVCSQIATMVDYVTGIKEVLYHYWQNDESVMHTDSKRRLYDTALAHEQIMENCVKMNWLDLAGRAYLVVLMIYLELQEKYSFDICKENKSQSMWEWLINYKNMIKYDKNTNYVRRKYFEILFINKKFFYILRGLYNKLKGR